MKAIQIKEFGGPEVLEHVDLPDPEPNDGEVVIDVARSGINFADTHATQNDYLAEQSLPMVPGGEVSGTTPDGGQFSQTIDPVTVPANGSATISACAEATPPVPVPEPSGLLDVVLGLVQGLLGTLLGALPPLPALPGV